MRKIISFMHLSLDGFVAGPNGEMNSIKVDEVPKVRRTPSEDAFGKIFDHVGKRISEVLIVPRWRGPDHRISYFTNWGGLRCGAFSPPGVLPHSQYT
jgi:hypothetical protein